MAVRKPLHEACDGGFDCPVPDHVLSTRSARGKWNHRHTRLTKGQQETLHERDRYGSGKFRIEFDYWTLLWKKRSQHRFETREAAQAWLDRQIENLDEVPDYWRNAVVKDFS